MKVQKRLIYCLSATHTSTKNTYPAGGAAPGSAIVCLSVDLVSPGSRGLRERKYLAAAVEAGSQPVRSQRGNNEILSRKRCNSKGAAFGGLSARDCARLVLLVPALVLLSRGRGHLLKLPAHRSGSARYRLPLCNRDCLPVRFEIEFCVAFFLPLFVLAPQCPSCWADPVKPMGPWGLPLGKMAGGSVASVVW